MNSKEIYDYIIKIQSIAKIGLVFSKDPYAITNYKEINELSSEFLKNFLEVQFDRNNYFERDIYPTPNISVRTIILNDDKTKVLMVREAKSQTYSFPGGWCDLYDSPSQAAKNECLQEAGADVEIIRLVGLMNRTPFKEPVSVPEYVIVFLGKLKGVLHEHEYETDEVRWFDVNDIPYDVKKVSREEMYKMLDACLYDKTIFD